MASPFQQKARQRKVIYLVLILALFTVSLLHRRLVVEKQAEDLQLRETARGEVELTSSFVRLSLTGSRGLATTILWATAIDRMAKHEWNELELLVSSISKLQPYFVTPWVFQSWNLAFNVAVECDRPRDKYYYISRGLELLAEGERRNQGTYDDAAPGRPKFPGNPEMRHYMGFYYQLKIGNSDEKNTMRCLLDMSCIDPIRRNPEKFWITEKERQVVKTDEFLRFCQDYPRLVRRLREQLSYDSPQQIVKFLEDNKDVPGRFKKTASLDMKESELEVPRKQFPVLPPVKPRVTPLSVSGFGQPSSYGPPWPHPEGPQLSPEAFDVFLICRTWYQYAQEPLPPPMPDPGVVEAERKYALQIARDRLERNVTYRPAKTMAIQIFRRYPARAQSYIAENLEAEGWFDEEGWPIKGWFEQGGVAIEPQVGTEPKYYAEPAWIRSHEMWEHYGKANGLYLTPADVAALERKAAPAREALKMARNDFGPTSPLSPEKRAAYGEGLDAHQKVLNQAHLRSMTNYDAALFQAEGERDPQTVLAHKLIYQALRYNRSDQHEALALYEQAWPLWVEVCLRYPNYARSGAPQDDIYEAMLKYVRLSQKQRPELFRAVMLGAAQLAVWPYPNWEQWRWIDSNQRAKIVTVRVARGPLELVAVYDGPEAEAIRDYWAGMTGAAGKLAQLGFTPPVPMSEFALAGSIDRRPEQPPTHWRYLIDADTIRSVRDRYGLLRPLEGSQPPPPGPEGPPGPQGRPMPKATPVVK
jgi:hypothetical protein